ncbi:TetR family transcriptional regulator C-terminal domain-containing protein [Flavivirga abyssicola]|uniref:TetR/AcrR family transcriptional regulator n=1 Tax=Flavivirga abyssicola TaxID=3063533 RepID=UPI0026DED9A8|nr:TetR/AcrR family transcriptional regulator [Flavivirga sp. MEBiC07777]WVK13471.1 TetR family transcriptional regulator C-terminal domain-containing protein [Flavivirga sp. MEBiC07777]
MAKHDINNILEKGIELFRLNGYHNTGIRDILKACEMPKGSFYHLFESKEDFVIKAIARFEEVIGKDFEKNLSDESLSHYERIKNHFKIYIIWYTEKDFKVGCLLGNLSTEVAGTIDPVSNAISGVYDRWSKGLASFIEKGQEKGEIIDTIEALHLANYLFDGFNGALGRMKVERSSSPLDQFLNINMTFIKKKAKVIS